MNTVTKINQWLTLRSQLKNKTIGFIPTMGNLHAGHLALCQRAKNENEITVVSIFVNPTQFNQVEDFTHYPRTLIQDQEFLTSIGVDYLFCPTLQDIYPDEYTVQVTETKISSILEGEFRPGHFNGMLTIVLKLLNLIAPTRAYFGEKDYQQLLLINKMTEALFLPVNIVNCETVRAEDNLALSSRNSRLTAEQRQKASLFPKILKNAPNIEAAISELQSLDFRVDYVAERWQRRLGAVWLDDIRLIDNLCYEKPSQ